MVTYTEHAVLCWLAEGVCLSRQVLPPTVIDVVHSDLCSETDREVTWSGWSPGQQNWFKYSRSTNIQSYVIDRIKYGHIFFSFKSCLVVQWNVYRHRLSLLFWTVFPIPIVPTGGLFSKTEMSAVLTEILKADPSFDKDAFLRQCEKDIIPNILEVRAPLCRCLSYTQSRTQL